MKSFVDVVDIVDAADDDGDVDYDYDKDVRVDHVDADDGYGLVEEDTYFDHRY